MAHLYENQLNSSWGWNYTGGYALTRGTRFRVTAELVVTQVGYYHNNSTDQSWSWLGMFDGAGVLMWHTETVPNTPVPGWIWVTVSPSFNLVPGVTYTVAGGLVGTRFWALNGPTTLRNPPPAGFIFDDAGAFLADGVGTYPTVPADYFFAVSVGTETYVPPAEPGEGEGEPALTGDLGSWLSNNPTIQTHETDGLPWLTKLVADATKNAVDAGRIVIDATKDIVDLIPKRDDSEWNAILKLWQIAGVLTEAEIDLWNLFAKRAPHQLTGPTPGGGSAFFGPSGGQVAERAEVSAFNSELLWHRTQTSNWLDPLPGGDWVLEDTLTWDGPIGWNQPADAYVLHITAYPATWDQQLVDGHLWLPRALWWAPLTDTIPHERHFGDMEFQILHNLPLRCAGILLCPQGGFSGTLEAWSRPAPAPLEDTPF